MKRIISGILSLIMILSMFTTVSFAAGGGSKYDFDLRANGQEKLTVKPGSSIDVTVDLSCNDSADSFTMYAANYVIWFDANFFTLDEESIAFGKTDENGITYLYAENTGIDGWASITASVKAPFEGKTWNNDSRLMTFTLKADKIGSSNLFTNRASMSDISGADLGSEKNNVYVIVTNVDETQSGGNENSILPGTGNGNTPSAPGGNDGAPTEQTKDNPFTDVKDGDWFADAVEYVWDNELFNGMSDTTFGPEGTMTRAMYVTVMNRYAGLPQPVSANNFGDVKNNEWYTSAICWAAENGIVNGVGGGNFAPDSDISLEAMITILYRFAGKPEISAGDVTKYGAISDWAKPAMKWAHDANLFDGVGGTLRAAKSASRAQVAAFIANFNEYVQVSETVK